MNMYQADLGSWRKGIVVEFQARNDENAWQVAHDLLSCNVRQKEIPSSSVVVQIKLVGGRAVYDYMNGFYPQQQETSHGG